MYYIVFGLLYVVSLLPLRVLYVLSSLGYLVVYFILGYRKGVVLQNLAYAFPQKSEKDREKTARQFYRNFIDSFIENIKFISASDTFFKKHFTGNTEILLPIHASGRKCQVLLAHNFNWELANLAVPLLTPFQMLTVYMPISNKLFNRLLMHIRCRTGAKMLAATRMSRELIPYRNQQYLMALVADQNPGNPANAYWFNFLGRPAPFVKGPEKNARANNAVIVYCYFTKAKRGYYHAHFELAETEPLQLPEKELMRRYVTYLEKVVTANPEMWLWSHRRWKHQWKPEYGPVTE
ncbi:MAG TPA: lysophospholipid acyltransferase family protein [Flavisolibacter sp.]|nr:lysophospholipid acyltransferase family protein [Flavisolibacter sp.]